MRRLETGVQSGMAKEVEQAAHRFAGASAACGMVAIVPCLRQLEDAGRTESLGGADAMFKRIEGEFEEIRKFVDREFPKSS